MIVLMPLLAACSPEPAAVVAPVVEPLAQPWRLVGLADDSHLPIPALVGGKELLGDACFTVNQRLGTLDPASAGTGPPCGAEEWTNGPDSFRLLWAGRAALFARGGVDHPARLQWNAIDTVLAACLGPPLNLPPAGDPGGTRSTDGQVWTLRLSANNTCGLEGALLLWIRADRASPANLKVDGVSWRSGGAEIAAGRLLEPQRASEHPTR